MTSDAQRFLVPLPAVQTAAVAAARPTLTAILNCTSGIPKK